MWAPSTEIETKNTNTVLKKKKKIQKLESRSQGKKPNREF